MLQINLYTIILSCSEHVERGSVKKIRTEQDKENHQGECKIYRFWLVINLCIYREQYILAAGHLGFERKNVSPSIVKMLSTLLSKYHNLK